MATLIEDMKLAAYAVDESAAITSGRKKSHMGPVDATPLGSRLRDAARRLREELDEAEAEATGGRSDRALAVWAALERINGGSPSQGTPTKTCETCCGSREVLWLHERPGSPPGNQMGPCPACTKTEGP